MYNYKSNLNIITQIAIQKVHLFLLLQINFVLIKQLLHQMKIMYELF